MNKREEGGPTKNGQPSLWRSEPSPREIHEDVHVEHEHGEDESHHDATCDEFEPILDQLVAAIERRRPFMNAPPSFEWGT